MAPYVRRPLVRRNCLHCAASFDGRPNTKYCSRVCRERAQYAMAARVPCTMCGGPTGWKIGAVPEATHNACRSEVWDHGTDKGYRQMGCRCELCTVWNRRNAAEYRARRKAEGRPIRSFGHSGPWIAPQVRLAVFERDGWLCQLCMEPVDRDAAPNGDRYPSLDHIVPQSKGGTHLASNLRTAHRWCNSVRGAEDYHSDLFQEA